MRSYDNESQAKDEIASTLRPIYGSAQLFVAERSPMNLGLREVMFVAKVKADSQKSEEAVNAFYQLQIASTGERIEWSGSKIDFLNDVNSEYIMIKAVVQNG